MNNLEMFKMNKVQMNNVNGGYNRATCNRLQQMANGDESEDWGPRQWDAWADLWEKNCN